MRASERTRRHVPESKGRLQKVLLGCLVGLVLLLAGLAGCRALAPLGEGKPKLALTSSSFQDGKILKKFTCDGTGDSPELGWTAPPEGTKSFALIVVDKDTRFSSVTHWLFTHWVLYDLPPEKRELLPGLPKQGELPDGSRQGRNDFEETGWGGPCPHWKSEHRYVFSLFALDTKLNLPTGATRTQVGDALKGHILASGELTGRYHR
jgi:Raf kinase inhibitor-like YbhB/YbcL family protein